MSDLEDEAKAGEDGKGRPKRGQGVQTKAYKEPVRREVKPARPRPKPKPMVRTTSPEYGRRLTMRASTAQKTSEIIRTMKQRDAEARRRKMKMKKHNKVRRKL